MIIDTRDTRVFDANPSTGLDFSIDDNANNWLWAVCAVYFVSFCAITAAGFKAPFGEKIFHYLFTVTLVVGAISYFTAASNLGWTPVMAIHDLPGERQIYYSKYINWFIGWTPLVTALGLISGVSWATISYNVALLWTWVICWLCGAVTHSAYKWAYFCFGSFIYFLLAISLVLGSGAAKRNGLAKPYLGLCAWLVGCWLPYNIAWALDDGGNQYTIARAWIFWGILDLATGPLVCIGVLAISRSWDPAAHNFTFTSQGRVPAPEPDVFPLGGKPSSNHASPAIAEKHSPKACSSCESEGSVV